MNDHLYDNLILYRLLNLKGVGPAKIHTIYAAAEKADQPLEDFINDESQIGQYLKPEQSDQLDLEYIPALDGINRLEQDGVTVLNYFADNYPVRLKMKLGHKAPLLLYVKGNQSLLDKVGVGFCGSRKASDKGIDTARDCTEQLACSDYNVTSGYAAGVDLTTHRVALESGGTTTIVLPAGISHFKVKRQLADQWDWDRICVVSEFLPGLPWSGRNAMQRNTTICALSHMMILIEAETKGGSIEAGKISLELNIPLLAPVYEGMPETAVGNRLLLEQGACRIHKSRSSGRANLGKVIEFLESRSVVSYDSRERNAQMVRETDQMGLFKSA